VIRLVALDQTTNTQTTLELEGSPSISLNLAVAKPGETMQRHAPYSQTFRLPFTNTNNQFFAHFYEVTLSDGDFDPTQKTEVELSEDGVPVMRGSMQLRAVRLMAEVYEVNVLSDVGDLFAEMGSKLLEAAFRDGDTDYITTFDYTQTAANIVTSQTLTNDITSGTVGNGTVIVPLADHGLSVTQQPITADDGYGLLDSGISSAATVTPEMLKPAIKLKAVTDRIIEQAGFYYSSTFFSSATYGSMYMTLATEQERTIFDPSHRCLAYLNTAQTVNSNGTTLITINTDSALDGFDENNNFNTTTSKYTTPSVGEYTFTAQAKLTLSGATTSNLFAFLQIQSAQGIIASQGVDFEPIDTTPVTVTTSGTAMLPASTEVFLELFVFGLGSLTIEVDGIDGGTSGPTFFRCTAAPEQAVSVPANLPRIKQKELFADLCQRFNLVIEASPDDPNKLLIEPYADWIGTGVDTYWTDKLDLDKERTLSPTSSIKSARIKFSDLDASDVGNANRTDSLGRVYGTFDQDIDDDFATGTLSNAPVFAPYFVYSVPTLAGDPATALPNLLIHRSYATDAAAVKPQAGPPKLFFALGNQTLSQSVYINDTALTTYQFCSPFSETPADSDTQTLQWNSSDTTFMNQHPLLGAVPPIGLHRTYWSAYLADIYDADARVFEAHLYLTPSDIRNLRFNDRFHILGAAYKLTEVSGYQIGTGESTLCKFLRDLGRSTVGACQNIPSTSNINGVVSFVNAAGSVVADPGRICCEAFGYYYDATTNTCRWDIDGPTPPAPPPPADFVNPIPNFDGSLPRPVSPTGVRTRTIDRTSGGQALVDTFVLMVQTTDASATALSSPDGRTIQVDSNTLASGVIHVSCANAQATDRFESKMETFRFLANGHAGTVTISATSGTSESSGSPGTRRLTAAIANGILTISANGDASTTIQWIAHVEMVRIYTQAGT
jgi:hypothetical protein